MYPRTRTQAFLKLIEIRAFAGISFLHLGKVESLLEHRLFAVLLFVRCEASQYYYDLCTHPCAPRTCPDRPTPHCPSLPPPEHDPFPPLSYLSSGRECLSVSRITRAFLKTHTSLGNCRNACTSVTNAGNTTLLIAESYMVRLRVS